MKSQDSDRNVVNVLEQSISSNVLHSYKPIVSHIHINFPFHNNCVSFCFIDKSIAYFSIFTTEKSTSSLNHD